MPVLTQRAHDPCLANRDAGPSRSPPRLRADSTMLQFERARAPWRNRTSINRLKAGCSAVELKGLDWIVGGAPSRLSCTIAQWPVP